MLGWPVLLFEIALYIALAIDDYEMNRAIKETYYA
jgi:hypothetical protein